MITTNENTEFYKNINTMAFFMCYLFPIIRLQNYYIENKLLTYTIMDGHFIKLYNSKMVTQ